MLEVKKGKRPPRFESDKEAAAFWDTHSFAPYREDSKPVKVFVRCPLKHAVHLSNGRRVTLAQFEKMRRAGTRKRLPSVIFWIKVAPLLEWSG